MYRTRTLNGHQWRVFWIGCFILLEGIAFATWSYTHSPTQLIVANVDLFGSALIIVVGTWLWRRIRRFMRLR